MHTRMQSGAAVLLVTLVWMLRMPLANAQAYSLRPAEMKRIGAVEERFQAYNVEMIEVTGGRFWKPYSAVKPSVIKPPATDQRGATPVGMDPKLYRYRPPIDLANPRLRRLAKALGPAYVRVSGTWANTVYFTDSNPSAPPKAPAGFSGVLTRKEWKGVIDFAHASDARIVTSFATSAGTRDASGVWTPDQARRLLAYTKAVGGSIAAAEFMNEPTYAAMGGAPNGYDAAAFGRDIQVFRRFIRTEAPDMLFLGPGSVGEGGSFPISLGGGILKTEDLLRAAGPVFDVFSYHLYAAASARCAGLGPALQTTAADALSDVWLARADAIGKFYAALRDRFEPGKPLWVTETADAACGGNHWASTFLDTFRYLDQHGRLAQRGVRVIAHNTLASSDYGLLDENTFAPRPNYWGALLWRKLMGTTVLEPGPAPGKNLYVYAHCLRGQPGGVAVLAINADQTASRDLEVPIDAERYTMTTRRLQDTAVQLNGHVLQSGADGSLPPLNGAPVRPGRVVLAPASITFLAIPAAGNGSCQ